MSLQIFSLDGWYKIILEIYVTITEKKNEEKKNSAGDEKNLHFLL